MSRTKTILNYSLLSLVIGLFLTSCIKFDEVEIQDVRSLRLMDFSERGISVNSEIKINNPNNFDISVVGSSFDIFLKNEKIGSAKIENKLKIPANSQNYHTLTLISDQSGINIGSLPQLIGLATGGSGKVKFRVEGHIIGKALLFRKKIKINHEDVVPLKFY